MAGLARTAGGAPEGVLARAGLAALRDRLGSVAGGGFSGLSGRIPALQPGKPELARALYRGLFCFGGATVECQPADVFSIVPPHAAWRDELTSFGWLLHLEATAQDLYRTYARSLFEIWHAQPRTSGFLSSCRRLAACAQFAQFFLDGSSNRFESLFYLRMASEARILARQRAQTPEGELARCAALLATGLTFRGGGGLRDEALSRLAAILPTLILADGGPVDRCPATLLSVLAQLLPLRLALEAQRVAIPREMNAAIERALPMLRMLCHGDGGLAVFQGVTHPQPGLVRAVLSRDEVLGRPLSQAAHSGFCRLAQGQSVVIADTGAEGVCQSALAFELSDGPQRIVTNCGAPPRASERWRQASCSASAHSTLALEGQSEQALQGFFARRARRVAQRPISADLVTTPHGLLLKAQAQHAANGLLHAREFFLAANGTDFRGEDRLTQMAQPDGEPQAFTLRFHLHPAIKPEAGPNGAIALALPGGGRWVFSARGGQAQLEDSISLASGPGPRKSRQIVIRGLAGRPERVNWAFKKQRDS
ncbi:heparinase II/III family protein [Aestuariivirga sp.]|uniref:heparinase II/III family protein n=1 Tax=Aestuariivirga sp. TaxID=2650926 RepID=UPI0039E48FC2